MPVAAILSGTPVWVWALFAFLLFRGIAALRAREMTPARMLVLPVIFLVWALAGMFFELVAWPAALAAFVVALAIGLAGGWANAARLPVATRDPVTGLVCRPGSATTLVLVLVGFVAKYVLSVALAMHANLGAQTGFAALFGGVSGLIDGAFWGGAALQFRQAFGYRAATI
ncbi:MAG: hypothetical protein P8Z80_14890 [Pseudolabrys sp.]